MRQFELYQNPSERSRPVAPFVVVLQSHLLDAMPTVIVAPLIVDDGRSAYVEASVRIEWEGATYLMSVGELVAIDARSLSRSLGFLGEHEDAIRRALERLFTGF